MNVRFRFNYFLVSQDRHRVLLRIYRMTNEPPKHRNPLYSLDEEATVRARDLTAIVFGSLAKQWHGSPKK